MASSVPIVKQAAAKVFFIQMIVLGLVVLLFYALDFTDYFLCSIASFAILVFVLRNAVAQSHRKGIRLVKAHKYKPAIPMFQKSVAFFTRHAWVDKYRYLILLSAAAMTYKEMGLCNIAFCYSQIEKGAEAKKYYRLVLATYPQNGLATAGLNMLNATIPEKPQEAGTGEKV